MSSLAHLVAFADPGGSTLVQFLPLVIIFAIFYFLLIMPMRRRQKELQKMIDNLKKGDKVVTTGGLHGEVAALETNTLVLKVADQVKLRVSRSAIAGMQNGEQGGQS